MYETENGPDIVNIVESIWDTLDMLETTVAYSLPIFRQRLMKAASLWCEEEGGMLGSE